MAMDPMDPNFPSQAYPPRKQGGSGLLWGLGIGCGLVLLLCCGGGVAIYWYGKGALNVQQSLDPAEVRAAGDKIVLIQLPQGFEPKQSIGVTVPFVNQRVEMAIYEAGNGAGSAFLMELSGGPAVNEEQARAQLETQLQTQGKAQRNLRDVESRQIEVQVRGQPATFTIQKGKDTQSNAEYIQASGSFKTDDGIGILIIEARADQYTEEQIEESLRSIQ
ncbi:MAG: hypothetical protein WD278_09040 [Pirellulales bacterium]